MVVGMVLIGMGVIFGLEDSKMYFFQYIFFMEWKSIFINLQLWLEMRQHSENKLRTNFLFDAQEDKWSKLIFLELIFFHMIIIVTINFIGNKIGIYINFSKFDKDSNLHIMHNMLLIFKDGIYTQREYSFGSISRFDFYGYLHYYVHTRLEI